MERWLPDWLVSIAALLWGSFWLGCLIVFIYFAFHAAEIVLK